MMKTWGRCKCLTVRDMFLKGGIITQCNKYDIASDELELH